MSINSVISERIKELVKSNGLQMKDFINNLKYDSGKFYSYLYNRAKWDIELVKNISEYFNTSIDFIAGKVETMQIKEREVEYGKIKSVPVFGNVYCGSPAPQWDVNEIKQYIDLPDLSKYKYSFGLIAKGDSMTPYINPGDFLICVDKPDLIKDGKAVVVVFKGTIDNNEVNAKLIRLDKRRSLVTLYSVNTKHPPVTYNEDEILKIYKLIRIIREVK